MMVKPRCDAVLRDGLMTRSPSPTNDDAKNAQEFQEFLSKLQEDPEKEPVSSEIEGTAPSGPPSLARSLIACWVASPSIDIW